jgi:hypothetical protein
VKDAPGADRDTYAGRNRYQTGINQESTTMQDDEA